MGYYTSYGLNCYGDPDKIDAFEKTLLEKSQNDIEVEELLDTGNTFAKLYELCDWITEIAKLYPDVLVILTGFGESQDDIWECRWKGEETECHTMVMPPFTNPNLLTN